ncbi:Vesicular-fusion protein [Apiospora arundinis]|uniref:Vesicular-fusion protein SEC18 n=1 Tax=Apiospora arundinis TaxID=335852 RepID=A0ABR2IG87_9PEZI
MDMRNNLFGNNPQRGNVGLPGRQVGGGAGGPPPPRPGAPGDSRPGSYNTQAPGPGGPRSPGMMRQQPPPQSMPPQQSMPQQGGYAGPPAQPVQLRVEKLPPGSLADRYIFGNLVAVSPEDFKSQDGQDVYVKLKGPDLRGEYVLTARPTPGFPTGCISLSTPQRSWCGIGLRDVFTGERYDPFSAGTKVYLGTIDLEIAFASAKSKVDTPFDGDKLADAVLDMYPNQIFAPGQQFLMDYRGTRFNLTVKTVSLINLGESGAGSEAPVSSNPSTRGILFNATIINLFKDNESGVNLKASSRRPAVNPIIRPDFNFADLGIGGVDEEFQTIFRRAFQSRLLPQNIVEQMGLPHVKGLLLYGPPGTGKTLIARQIGKMLNAREPKIINGPEILNKFVGQSEENVRKMFADAEKEYKEKGDESGLHIIIFDELDAVCKQRGSGGGGGTGVGDSVVNQLLTKLDGVEQLNNILLIGMTNRKDMIDEALLRSGRLEVHVEIGLPDEHGREQILNIHTGKMRQNGRLSDDVDVAAIAALTKNYSGAELNGVCKSAASHAFNRHVKLGSGGTVDKSNDVENIMVTQEDFWKALDDVKPAFGVSEDDLKRAKPHGIYDFSPHVRSIQAHGDTFSQLLISGKGDLTSVLLYGPDGSGKTALAADIALNSEFPLVKMVRANDMVGMSEQGKVEHIKKAFTDAYKSTLSVLILDEIESMISYIPVGPRFMSEVATTIGVLMKSQPPKGRRLMVIGTTSQPRVLEDLNLRGFSNKLAVPRVRDFGELQALLAATGAFQDADINETLHELQGITGSQKVDMGVKRVIELIASAQIQATKEGRPLGMVFAEVLSEAMSSQALSSL